MGWLWKLLRFPFDLWIKIKLRWQYGDMKVVCFSCGKQFGLNSETPQQVCPCCGAINTV